MRPVLLPPLPLEELRGLRQRLLSCLQVLFGHFFMLYGRIYSRDIVIINVYNGCISSQLLYNICQPVVIAALLFPAQVQATAGGVLTRTYFVHLDYWSSRQRHTILPSPSIESSFNLVQGLCQTWLLPLRRVSHVFFRCCYV